MSSDLNRIDARGLRCPLPVLKLEKRIGQVPPGTVLTVLATDPVARIDIPLYCLQHGHACTVGETEGATAFTIVSDGAAAAAPAPPREQGSA